MSKFKDFIVVSKIAFRETIKKLNKSYMVFIFILINTIFENNEFSFGVVGGTIGGIVNYFIGVIITCFVIQSLSSVVKYGNTGKNSLENSVGNFFCTINRDHVLGLPIRDVFKPTNGQLPLPSENIYSSSN